MNLQLSRISSIRHVRLISTNLAQRPIGPLIRALIGIAQPFHGWWAPIAQHHKKGGGGRGTRHEIHLRRHNPTYILTLSRSREEALPATGSTTTGHRRLCTVDSAPPLYDRVSTASPTPTQWTARLPRRWPMVCYPTSLSLCFLALDHVLGFTPYPKCQFDPLDL